MNQSPRNFNSDPQAAVNILDSISDMLQRRELAARLDFHITDGRNLLGGRQSLLDPGFTERFRRDINEAIVSIGGIRTFLDTPRGTVLATLVSWMGVTTEEPDKHTWRVGEIQQGGAHEQAEVRVNFDGLRQHLIDEQLGTTQT